MASLDALTVSNFHACLIVFTRYPQPGKAKTRLIPALGAAGAATLQRQMTEYTLKQAQRLVNLHPLSVEVWFAGTDPETDRQQMQDWLGSDWVYRSQAAGDLGERMANAFQTAFDNGSKQVVTIGTDCPELDAAKLLQAFQLLQDNDLVLGPATDGGYYLIGLRRFVPELFTGIAWSTEKVLQQTIEIAQRLALSIGYLDALTDIDRPQDLPVWQAVLETPSLPEISVVIPVLNEANRIQQALQTIQTACQNHQKIEIIVADGGSQDDTIALAKSAGATVITTQPGRAYQMNAGAKIATGKILLFLHADTRLPHQFDAHAKQALTNPKTIAGAFQLQIDGTEQGLRWVEQGVLYRSRWFQLPYGDQALFLRASTFRQLGGFPELPIMEDFVFVRHLQALGRIAIAPAAVITSARRWQKLGVVKTTVINQLMIMAYFLGVPTKQLAKWYREAEARERDERKG